MSVALKAIIIFFITYIFIIVERQLPLSKEDVWWKRYRRIWIVLVGILLLLGTKTINFQQSFSLINFNVLGIFLGMMILSSLLAESGVPEALASSLISKCKSVGGVFLILCVLSGIISSFLENVVTLFILAPIALEVSKRMKTSAIPLFIGIAVSSNLQGCATMIGDSPSIILAMSSGMSFNDFFWMIYSVLDAARLGLVSLGHVLGGSFHKFLVL